MRATTRGSGGRGRRDRATRRRARGSGARGARARCSRSFRFARVAAGRSRGTGELTREQTVVSIERCRLVFADWTRAASRRVGASSVADRFADSRPSPLPHSRARERTFDRARPPPRARLRARVSSHRVVVVVDSERHASSRGPRFRRRRRPRIRRRVARRPRRLRRPRRPRRPRRLRRGTSRRRRRCASASRRVRRRAIRARRDRLAPRPSRVAIPIRSWVFLRRRRARAGADGR